MEQKIKKETMRKCDCCNTEILERGKCPQCSKEPQQEVYHREDPLSTGSDSKRLMFTGSANQCWVYIHKHQSQSVDWACKYGGWSIKSKEEK